MEKRKRTSIKYVFLILASFVLAIVGSFQLLHRSSVTQTNSNVSSELLSSVETPETSSSHRFQEISFHDTVYNFEIYEVNDSSKLRLIGNFKEKKTMRQIMEEKGCVFAINAGFYSKTNAPLGMFVGMNYEQPVPLQSALFNGYICITSRASAISLSPPDDYISVVQTGPMLLSEGKPLLLAIKNDTPERRAIAGITKEGYLLFLILFTKGSTYDGPLLGDVPTILQQINSILASPLQTAINLDGGTASSFMTPTTTIQELSSVGSIFCLTK